MSILLLENNDPLKDIERKNKIAADFCEVVYKDGKGTFLLKLSLPKDSYDVFNLKIKDEERLDNFNKLLEILSSYSGSFDYEKQQSPALFSSKTIGYISQRFERGFIYCCLLANAEISKFWVISDNLSWKVWYNSDNYSFHSTKFSDIETKFPDLFDSIRKEI